MAKRSLAIGSVVALAVGGAIGYWWSAPPSERIIPGASVPDSTEKRTIAGPEGMKPSGDAVLSASEQALLEHPETLEFERRLDFQQQVRNYFDSVAGLSPAEREQQASEIRESLARYEADGEVSAREGLMLRLALVQTTVSGEEAQKAAMKDLISAYQSVSEARLQAWKSQPKPEFEAYKAKEAAIVEEVMAMQSIPGGMSRDEYLRQRLQQAREEAYGSSGG